MGHTFHGVMFAGRQHTHRRSTHAHSLSLIRWWAMLLSHSSLPVSQVPCWSRPMQCRRTSTCWWMRSARTLSFLSGLFPGTGAVGWAGDARAKGLEDWDSWGITWASDFVVGDRYSPRERKINRGQKSWLLTLTLPLIWPQASPLSFSGPQFLHL